jgi:hypothetical protein
MPLHPEFEHFSFVRGELVLAQEDANWLEGESLGWGFWLWCCFPDCLLSMIIHLAVELGVTQEATMLDAVVLMSLNVGKYPREGEIAAVSHNGLHDVGVAALCWDLVWWQILNLVQCSQGV